VVDSIVQDMSFAIKDIQGIDGIVIRTKSKDRADNICDDMNRAHRLSCCKDSANSNGWRHSTSCSNWVMCY
jgi:hypothetical protein